MKDHTIAIEAHRLMRMAISRNRRLNKQIDALENELLDRYNSHLAIDKLKTDKLNRLTKQRDTWGQVIEWLSKHLFMLDAEKKFDTDKEEEINLGESYQLTDEEKHELLSKLTREAKLEFSSACAEFYYRCEKVGIRVSGVSFYPECKSKPQND